MHAFLLFVCCFVPIENLFIVHSTLVGRDLKEDQDIIAEEEDRDDCVWPNVVAIAFTHFNFVELNHPVGKRRRPRIGIG